MWVFLSSYPDMLAAAVAFGLLVMVAVTSVRIARRRLKYETWWVVHLYTYIALSLAFAHQIATGVSFVGHPLARAIWATAWASTAGLVIFYRVAVPIARNLRHQLRVEWAREEAPGVYSVVCRGRRIDRLAVSGGPVLPVALSYKGPVVAGSPVLAVCAAAPTEAASDG